MRYLCAGSGSPILLIHGLLGYSFSWRFNLTALSQHHTVYAPDLLGTGFSEKPSELDCCLQAIAGRLLDFLEALEISACDLLGTSHGGAIAMMLAAEGVRRGRPHIRRMVLVGSVNPWSPARPMLMRILRTAIGAALFRALAPHLGSAHGHVLRRMYGDAHRIPADSLAGYSAPFAVPGSFEYALSVVRAWRKDMVEIERVLPQIADLPTLLLWGSRDRAVSLQSASRLRRHFRECELKVLEGAGHMPYEEMPAEFNRVVLDFLNVS